MPKRSWAAPHGLFGRWAEEGSWTRPTRGSAAWERRPCSTWSRARARFDSRRRRGEDRPVLATERAYEVADVEFDAEGVALRGWLYRPRDAASAAPAVVMAHGYNCIKELYLDNYAAALAGAGHVVLAYDHRNFGDSDGEPRQELDPLLQVRDYRNAITFVQTLDGVDPERIGIWGTSLSGGHVLMVAAIDR